ncbi:MAG: hypothetical protein SV108_01230 [Pseudomonadota bacterium]|nr:hypothetical protein [Pseudomonadota bacterium]
MQVYLVGGAVRDELLGLPVQDRDWVVVGATPEALAAQGFRPVGRDFPVFLHPRTHEEYALARTERKAGRGYHGFAIDASPAVTLPEDLARRDFTINAMARDDAGHLIDPYDGQADLAARWLRHVSPAFSEDPLRVLRAARLLAQLAPQGFRLHPSTAGLIHQMVRRGELAELTAERVWQELRKALLSAQPRAFFDCLLELGALRALWPELAAAPRLPAGLAALEHVPGLPASPPLSAAEATLAARLGALALGAALGVEAAGRWLAGLRAPRRIAEPVELVLTMPPPTPACAREADCLQAQLERLDAFRRPERLPVLGAIWRACGTDPRLVGRLEQAGELARAISARDLDLPQLTGPAVGEALRRTRIDAIARGLADAGSAQANTTSNSTPSSSR